MPRAARTTALPLVVADSGEAEEEEEEEEAGWLAERILAGTL
jgi:hypothetical protein